VVDYNRQLEDRVAVAERIAAETGAILVPSFDDVDIIEGQGSVGVEIAAQLGQVNKVVVPCGGGGLASGIALALPEAEIVLVEPQGWDDMAQSLDRGRIVGVGANAPATSCDALQTPLVSPLTFEVLRERGARAVSVSEQEVALAMFVAMRELRLVVEPGGAVALAALLAGKVGSFGPETVIILSGGNVDPANYARILTAQAAELIR
jgi:threonine dehydratase